MKWSKKATEEYIANRLIGQLNDGWTVHDAHREEPDLILFGPDGKVGAELCGYRSNNTNDAAVDYAKQMLCAEVDDWINDPAVHHWSVDLEYRQKKKKNGFYVMVPAPKNRAAFWCELKQLVVRHEKKYGITKSRIVFSEDLKRARPGFITVKGFQYPTLYQHLKEIVIRHTGDVQVGLHRDSLSVGYIGIESNKLTKLMKDKYKRLPTYRKNLQKLPIWLILHNDGDAVTRRIIPEVHLRHAAEILSQIERDEDDCFDRVLWGVNVLLEGPDTGMFYDLRSSPILPADKIDAQ